MISFGWVGFDSILTLACGVMFIVVGNEHGDTFSKPRRD